MKNADIEKTIDDASADDLRAMVRMAREALTELHSEVMHYEGIQEGLITALERSDREAAKLKTIITQSRITHRVQRPIRSGSVHKFKALIGMSKGPIPF